MRTVADGLALSGLVVNVFIALGTVGAAGVALWLGLQARRAGTAQERDHRLKLNRQVLCVFNPERPHVGSWVEVVNASPEPITSVHVLVHTDLLAADETPQARWEWRDDSLASAFPTINYLVPGASMQLPGAFWLTKSGAPSPQRAVRASEPLSSRDVSVELMWQDSHGEVWNKRGQDEAFPTSWAAPWRDLRPRVPRYAWPPYWPPMEPEHAREPLRERTRRAGQRLRSRFHRQQD